MIGLPITLPFGLVPVLPNIPFFYLAFRCWSHWRALKGSDHLSFILDHRLYRPVSSAELEAIYLKTAPHLQNSFNFVTRSQVLDGTDPEEQLLLPAGSHKVVAEQLKVPELVAELERAIHQIEEGLKREEAEKTQKQHVQAEIKQDNERPK